MAELAASGWPASASVSETVTTLTPSRSVVAAATERAKAEAQRSRTLTLRFDCRAILIVFFARQVKPYPANDRALLKAEGRLAAWLVVARRAVRSPCPVAAGRSERTHVRGSFV